MRELKESLYCTWYLFWYFGEQFDLMSSKAESLEEDVVISSAADVQLSRTVMLMCSVILEQVLRS